jgi:prepilin-type processing-associated H-X9-DG protein
MHQVGQALLMYANNNQGTIYPPFGGSHSERENRWPAVVFKPPVWNPPILKCPSDQLPAPPPAYIGDAKYKDGDENGADHSYILNENITDRRIKVGSKDLGGLTASEFIVMGEKKTTSDDYYSGVGPGIHDPYVTIVYEGYRHGLSVGSNYLFLDWHVEAKVPQDTRGINPWSQ